jgi:SAM-dependent methyltransferase
VPYPKNIIASVKNTYNDIGSEFSATRKYLWPDLKPFLSLVKPDSSVLDVGCGNGRLLLGLPQNTRYTGLDISQELLKETQKTYPNRKFIEADITQDSAWENLPTYDYIFSVAVFHHLPTKKDQLMVLKQIKKHLKPGGKVLITAWNLWQPRYFKHHLSLNSLSLKCNMRNVKCLFVPFQAKPRFCFAATKPYLKYLLQTAGLKLKIKKAAHNYLIY